MPRRGSAVAAAVLAAIVAATQLGAQDDTAYLQLLDAYARNDSAAAASLGGWSERRVTDAVRALDQRTARDRARAAVMLHTEAALTEAANQRESFHVEVARGDARRTRLEINQGLAVDGKHRDLNLTAGALIEYEIAQEEPNLRGHWNVSLEREDILRKRRWAVDRAARRGSRAVKALIAAGMLAAVAPIADLQRPAPPAAFKTRVDVVQLDVSVLRRAMPVRGLTAADFVVTDNGAPQAVDRVVLD